MRNLVTTFVKMSFFFCIKSFRNIACQDSSVPFLVSAYDLPAVYVHAKPPILVSKCLGIVTFVPDSCMTYSKEFGCYHWLQKSIVPVRDLVSFGKRLILVSYFK